MYILYGLLFTMYFFPDVSLPALFMPFTRGTVFNPRAHQYFHPTGIVPFLLFTNEPQYVISNNVAF